MLTPPQRWLFFTAGLGSDDFESSALRLVNQARSFELFDTVKAFTTEEVKLLCPRLTEWYSEEELPELKGFGWYTWKSKLADLVVREHLLGEFDGYLYLDAGCEFFLSGFSKRRLQSMMLNASQNNTTLFTIPTPEIWHTKNAVLQIFEGSEAFVRTDQFQSGSWLITNSDVGKELVKRWEEIASISPIMTDESPSLDGENIDFRVHRYDQAIFSMVCKDLGLRPTKYVIPGSNQSLKYFVRAYFYPFWWARNRTGQSIIPNFLRTLGRLTAGVSR